MPTAPPQEDIPLPRGRGRSSPYPPPAAPAAPAAEPQPTPGVPQAGTPEMDQFIQQINMNPAVMQTLPPQAIAEVLKHLGLDKSDVDEVGQWMDDAADKSMGVPSDVGDGAEEMPATEDEADMYDSSEET